MRAERTALLQELSRNLDERVRLLEQLAVIERKLGETQASTDGNAVDTPA